MLARKGMSLTVRGAFYSARAEFIQALRLVAQGLDAETGGTDRSRALANGLRALEEAELMADCKIATVFTGIAGSHILAENCKGVVALKKAEVTREDIHRAIESARIANDMSIHSLGSPTIATSTCGALPPCRTTATW